MENALNTHDDFLREVAEWRIHYLDMLRAGMETLALRQQTLGGELAKRRAAVEACRIYVSAQY